MADTEEKKIVTEEQVMTCSRSGIWRDGSAALTLIDCLTTWILETNSTDISIHRRKLRPLPMSTLSLSSSFPKSRSRLWKKTKTFSSRCRSFLLPCFKTPGGCALGCYALPTPPSWQSTFFFSIFFFFNLLTVATPQVTICYSFFINHTLLPSAGVLSSSVMTKV